MRAALFALFLVLCPLSFGAPTTGEFVQLIKSEPSIDVDSFSYGYVMGAAFGSRNTFWCSETFDLTELSALVRSRISLHPDLLPLPHSEGVLNLLQREFPCE
ncbi:Rap1a/Tai family immunity protein [Kineobactrum salinum]|uniref:Rap1a/Tai family immunity protein n=1 Tax=Kineobactrum salinum TaxID=2708301 RepID=UPI0038CC1CDB